MKAIQILLGIMIMGFMSFLFGCNTKSQNNDLPQLLSTTEVDFANLTFRIVQINTDTDGSQRLIAKAIHKNQVVGLEVRLGMQWKNVHSGIFSGHLGVVVYASLGAESDALMTALSEIYQVKAASSSMKQRIEFTGFSLKGNPSDLMSDPVKIKLFFESSDEERYAELYTNIDLRNRILEINEKDFEYREPLLRAIGQ